MTKQNNTMTEPKVSNELKSIVQEYNAQFEFFIRNDVILYDLESQPRKHINKPSFCTKIRKLFSTKSE